MSRRQLTYVLGVIALVVVVNLFSGGRWLPDRSRAGKFAETARVGRTFARDSPNTGTRAGQYTGLETDLPTWLPDALSHPDPRVRIRALETWAQHPGETLDPVTYALVDPDESVRARAQELLEVVLARR
jgi:hypothetical protein